jgi:hypothetical protein
VGVEDVRWDKSGTETAGEYTLFYGKGNENYVLNTSFCVHKGIISGVKRVEFFSDRMSCIMSRGFLCDVFLNVHAPTEDKIVYRKDRFYEELERVFDKYPKYHMKMLFGDFSAEVGREDIYKSQIGK